MSSNNRATVWIFWILRMGVAMEFIGHGMLGLNHPPAWAAYFAVVGIGGKTALSLMPWVGVFDIAMAFVALFFPCRALLLYMTIWGLWTALLRPLAGEPAWEAIERAGNYGVTLALFLFIQAGAFRVWRSKDVPESLPQDKQERIEWVMRLTTVLVLLGHGALQLLVHKKLFIAQYGFIGLNGTAMEPWMGGLEIALALAVLFRADYRLLIGVVVWKLATEALSPIAGLPLWVFIEHGGSYAAPMALAVFSYGRTRESNVIDSAVAA